MIKVRDTFGTTMVSKGKRASNETAYVNVSGDIYVKNEHGHITYFRYGDQDAGYTFEYAPDGNLSTISSTLGWTWTHNHSSEFKGWTVRNCLEKWRVSEEHCGNVYVSETGIQTTGQAAGFLGLPQRSNCC
jgi:hypothetical protein